MQNNAHSITGFFDRVTERKLRRMIAANPSIGSASTDLFADAEARAVWLKGSRG